MTKTSYTLVPIMFISCSNLQRATMLKIIPRLIAPPGRVATDTQKNHLCAPVSMIAATISLPGI